MRSAKKFIPFLIILALLFVPAIGFSQPDPCTDPDQPCPIDGGISLLIAAGIGFRAKKAYDKKKQRTVEL
jgi:hypothetical protein